MDLCSIIPVAQSSWMYKNPRVMLLTHLVEKYPEYVDEALKHPNTYKILDNSLIELGGAVSIERVVKAAEKVKADEIILCDVFRDAEGTITNAKKSIEWLRENDLLGKYKLQAVVHGSTLEDFKRCFNELNAMPEIDVIAIPKVTSSYEWCADHRRASLFNIFKNTDKEIHFLGSWYNLEEIYNIPREVWERVRSADTCLPSLYVIQNKHVWENREGTIDLEKNYPELTEEKYDKVMDELEQMIVKYQLY